MKLWKSNIRIFKGLGRSLAYHFGSVTTRKKVKNYLLIWEVEEIKFF